MENVVKETAEQVSQNPMLSGVFSWVLFGLAAGVVAKLILPGPENIGWIRTIVIGIAGSFVGGFVGQYLGFGSAAAWSWQGFGTAVVGAVILLLLNRLVTRT
jgi:uncharacterized membrane protein YeaQ/YmgE (transglycosylase-associated protein family)